VLEDKDIDRLREIFVTRQECQAQTDSFESKLNKDLVRLAVIETEMKQIKWILSTVAAGIVTMLIKMFFGS
jgi:hypothetical protein